MTWRRLVLVVAVLAVVVTAAGVGSRSAISAPPSRAKLLLRRPPAVAPTLTPKVATLKAGPEGEGVSGSKPVEPAPAALPATRLAGLVGVAPGEVYAVLSPRRPYVANRAYWSLYEPQYLDPYAGVASSDGVVWFGSEFSRANVRIRPHISRGRYLIDCTVRVDGDAQMEAYTGPSNITRVSPVDGHVLCVVETYPAQWNTVFLQRADHGGWGLYRCEVTYLGTAGG